MRQTTHSSIKWFSAAIGTFLLLAAGGTTYADEPKPEPATLVVTDATIMTMNPRYPRAEALAARGEWIVEVGPIEDIKPYIGPDTKVIDVDGRLVVPGFNDSHCHFADGARLLRELNLYGVDSKQNVLGLVTQRVKQAEPGEWIYGSRYDHTLWGDGETWPTKQDLDAVAPNNPVVLTRASGHSVWVNSLALKKSNITADTPDPPGGEIQRDPKTGEPTGILLETAANLLNSPRNDQSMSKQQRRERRKRDLVNGFEHAAKLGITSVQTSSTLPELELVRELKNEKKLTLRYNGWLRLDDAPQLAEQGVRSGDGDRWVRVGFLKAYIDGTLGDGTAAMFEPFKDRPDFTGLPRMTQSELNEKVLYADRMGFQIGIHAIGDKGVHMTLNAFELARQRNGRTDARHRIEHAQLIHPDDIRRFAALNVIPSMQQTHCTTDMRFAETRVGRERCKTAYAWRSLVDAGAMLAFGTDWSVEPLDPMRGVFSSVTRTNIQQMQPKTGWFPEQKLSVWESMYYYTHGSAYAEHMEDVKGTLAPGKLADLVVLDHNLFRIEPAQILETKVDYTIVEGRVVWDREADRYGYTARQSDK